MDLKLNNLDLSGNTTDFKTLPTRPRSHDIDCTEQKKHRRVTPVGTFEVCVPMHVALRMFIMPVWPVNCIFWPIETLNWLFRHYSGQSIA